MADDRAFALWHICFHAVDGLLVHDRKERHMTSHAPTTADRQSLDRLKLLVLLAVAAVMVAVAAGALLLILDPTSGSSTEAALGVAAAIGGIASGVLVIAALIYAQVKNLWRLAPIGIRIVLWVFIAFGVAVTVWNLISQPFSS
ncbi:MAG: hypothetical protein DRJ28_04790 [Actinobacteria bacterium]|nr:MAG: hypothetical protein DRJ28_04790 [Actinomycetota bacterium]